jgi:hypothetical protein
MVSTKKNVSYLSIFYIDCRLKRATGIFKVAYVAHILFLLDSAELEETEQMFT